MSGDENLIGPIVDKLNEAVEKLKSKQLFQSMVYRDEPIIRTAGQLPNYVPEEIREMEKISYQYDSYRSSEAVCFYKQGKFMEQYEDNFEYHGEFSRYFPTYRDMDRKQLRGYFSWRTRVRQGVIAQTSLSFAFVYLYELLNQIGTESVLDGFHKLKDFWSAYRELDSRIDSYAKAWLKDYVVYYGLDVSLLDKIPGTGISGTEISDTAFDQALMVLLDAASFDEETVFSAIKALSSYSIEHSKFYKQYPEDIKQVAYRVFLKLSAYYEKHGQKGLCEKLFGKKISCPYVMFSSAVFYDREKYKDREYVVNAIHRYTCKDGRWFCEKYYGGRGKNQKLGELLKAVDSVLRKCCGFPHPLKVDGVTKLALGIIEKETLSYLEEKKKKEAAKIEIDITKLSGIRHASEVIRDRLLVEEEAKQEQEEQIEDMPLLKWIGAAKALPEEKAVTDPEESEVPETEAGLDEIQYKFLQCMLEGEPYQAFLKERGVLLSVLVDSINEALFDRFGDTVLVFEGDTPKLLEDYTEELKGLVTG